MPKNINFKEMVVKSFDFATFFLFGANVKHMF